jgi:hypothetical protein
LAWHELLDQSSEWVAASLDADILGGFEPRLNEGSPVEGFSRGFRVFCEVVDAKRDATILTYHEGKSLSSAAPGES